MSKEATAKFEERCPRQLDAAPCSACPLALERLNAMRADGQEKKRRDPESLPGCPWYIASHEHHFCFWVFAQSLDEPVPDKDICALLGISQATLEKTADSAIEKLQAIKDTEVIRDIQSSVADQISTLPPDYTTFMPDEFRDMLKRVSQSSENGQIMDDVEREIEREQTKKARKHPHGLPLHRDGKKVDLFGLYSRKRRVTPVVSTTADTTASITVTETAVVAPPMPVEPVVEAPPPAPEAKTKTKRRTRKAPPRKPKTKTKPKAVRRKRTTKNTKTKPCAKKR